jgi:flavin reductase (DIM6/NTAB) family NADH-FMN oxidoreductase RutF
MPVQGDVFKQALASWASGVTIVTARHGDEVQGMTVSAFSSVSLDPPLVLVCAERSTITHGLIERAGAFSVSILARDQHALSNRFASKQHEHERFVGLECCDGSTGCPRIPGAIAWLDCRVVQTVRAGDHVVYIGEVETAELSERSPLVYFRGRYASLA